MVPGIMLKITTEHTEKSLNLKMVKAFYYPPPLLTLTTAFISFSAFFTFSRMVLLLSQLRTQSTPPCSLWFHASPLLFSGSCRFLKPAPTRRAYRLWPVRLSWRISGKAGDYLNELAILHQAGKGDAVHPSECAAEVCGV